MGIIELLEDKNDKEEIYGEIQIKVFNTMKRILGEEKFDDIENEVAVGRDDWLEDIYLDEEINMVVFKNAHTEVFRDYQMSIEELKSYL